MKIELLTQPLAPQETWLGYKLKKLLNHKSFNRFMVTVAFAKVSGVSRIYDDVLTFKNNGGRSVMSVGIDQKGTSKQALKHLCNIIDDLYVYHDSAQARTFHPKIYSFEELGKNSVVILGSGNLTSGGLFTNYEANTFIEFDLAQPEDEKKYKEIINYQASFCDSESPCVLKINEKNLELIEDKLFDEENEAIAGTEDEASKTALNQKLPNIFGTFRLDGNVPIPSSEVRISRKNRKGKSRKNTATPPGDIGFWKILSTYDASKTSSPGQIQIPIQFQEYFPPLKLIQVPDVGGRGRMWECHLPVKFVDDGFIKEAKSARFIVYEPKTGHPRPNTECRFTFHDREIANRLQPKGMLVFKAIQDEQNKFIIESVKLDSPLYNDLRKKSKARWGKL